jgi:hypothetical protein
MTLPASGTLSFLSIQNEFGGTAPIGLNEYYRGGGLVPATDYTVITPAVYGWVNNYSTEYQPGPPLVGYFYIQLTYPEYGIVVVNMSGNWATWEAFAFWNGVQVIPRVSGSGGLLTVPGSGTVGNTTYFKRSAVSTTVTTYTALTSIPGTYEMVVYGIRKEILTNTPTYELITPAVSGTTDINTSVPSSGTISVSNLYGSTA